MMACRSSCWREMALVFWNLYSPSQSGTGSPWSTTTGAAGSTPNDKRKNRNDRATACSIGRSIDIVSDDDLSYREGPGTSFLPPRLSPHLRAWQQDKSRLIKQLHERVLSCYNLSLESYERASGRRSVHIFLRSASTAGSGWEYL